MYKQAISAYCTVIRIACSLCQAQNYEFKLVCISMHSTHFYALLYVMPLCTFHDIKLTGAEGHPGCVVGAEVVPVFDSVSTLY